MSLGLRQLVEENDELVIQQVKEFVEIFTDFETVNKYQVLDTSGVSLGHMAEVGGGFFSFIKRQIFRSHRPLEIKVWNNGGEEILHLERPFFFFFSLMKVTSGEGKLIGYVRRRFGLIYKKYDLLDEREGLFGMVKSPIWRLWSFPILDTRENEVGLVSKNWGGVLKEVFTDADKFGVKLPQWEYEKKAVAFACTLAVDLDFFEDNQRRR